MSETICAIATAIVPQAGSVGIVRLSGSEALAIAQRVFRPQGKPRWQSHLVLYGHFVVPGDEPLDECLFIYMQAPRSFTREDVVEFHCHGGIAIVQQVLHTCLKQGARLAQPGEFTLRAFLNGRIDLTEAEAVAELVAARSPEAARLAMAGLEGKLASEVRALRTACLEVLVELEARLDFEDDLPVLDEAWVHGRLNDTLDDVRKVIATSGRGELLRTGLTVAIVGRPNVGKSSLLNAWSRTERAIVTELPGTTRDVVESMLNVQGIPVQVLDTAGIRDASDPIEQIGIERSHAVAQRADLILLVVDYSVGWTPQDQRVYDQVCKRPVVIVINKTDCPGLESSFPAFKTLATIRTCAARAEGIDELEKTIVQLVGKDHVHAGNYEFAVNQRQLESLVKAEAALVRVVETAQAELPLDFWTIDLRTAVAALGEVTGETVTEAVLKQIFSKFCIGK